MAQPGSITLRVYIKATTNEAVSVPVPVSYIEQRNTARLRDKLAKSRELEGVLRTHYRDGDWEILDHLDRPYDPDATTLENNSTLVLGKQREEKKCQITLKVTHQAHHKVMTDSAARSPGITALARAGSAWRAKSSLLLSNARCRARRRRRPPSCRRTEIVA